MILSFPSRKKSDSRREIRASLIVQLLKNPCAKEKKKKRIRVQSRRPRFNSWVGKIRWRRDRLPTPVFLGVPDGSAGQESACNVGDLDLIPGLGRSPGEGNSYPFQYSGPENSMDYTVHGVAELDTTEET